MIIGANGDSLFKRLMNVARSSSFMKGLGVRMMGLIWFQWFADVTWLYV